MLTWLNIQLPSPLMQVRNLRGTSYLMSHTGTNGLTTVTKVEVLNTPEPKLGNRYKVSTQTPTRRVDSN
ncbi:MAG: hypothetical protein H6634_15495 [Anaerolineales bacterium]|nr:hypothetical protein [Anaerolineales bacterium]